MTNLAIQPLLPLPPSPFSPPPDPLPRAGRPAGMCQLQFSQRGIEIVLLSFEAHVTGQRVAGTLARADPRWPSLVSGGPEAVLLLLNYCTLWWLSLRDRFSW